jgi:soluble lytic murein transglycosylase-like protein
MLGVFVQFRYDNGFDAQKLRAIALGAKAMFEGMQGLRSKAFTLNPAAREATNFYVWDSEAAARALFTDDMVGKIADIYGVRPTITFVEIAVLVDNHAKPVA